tara:strand:+ start:445 stop:732 length:288 start_codon:yes stop_codon:yes gene_type:complete
MKMQIDTKALDAALKDMVELKQSLLDSAYKHFVSITPVNTGNARRNTKQTKDAINADYPYADRLDNGWSKQAPEGMTGPTEQFLENEIQNILKGK